MFLSVWLLDILIFLNTFIMEIAPAACGYLEPYVEITKRQLQVLTRVYSRLRFCKTAQEFTNDDVDKRALTKKGLIENIQQGKYNFTDKTSKDEMIEYLTRTEPKEKKTWPCPLCPTLTFHKKRDQVTHIKMVHGQIKRFICDRCDKPFPVS